MLRRLFTVLSALSLALCAAVVVLWARSYRATTAGADVSAADDLPLSLFRESARYTLRSAHGRLVLLAPPPPRGSLLPPPAPAATQPATAPAGETAAQVVARLSNGHLEWVVERPLNWRPSLWAPGRATGPFTGSPHARPGSPADLLLAGNTTLDGRRRLFTPDAVIAALVAALEDPNRFAAAHVLLTYVTGAYTHGWEERTDGTFVQTLNGLRVELTPGPDQNLGVWHSYGDDSKLIACDARTDPAQIPALLGDWRRALRLPAPAPAAVRPPARTLLSVPHWAAAACASGLPACGLILSLRRRLRTAALRRQGRCILCGYDLRASPHRCPECGEYTL